MPPPKKDSVHRYFSYNAANNSSKCNLCEKNIKGKHTSNLKSHLATKHTAEFQIVSELNKINAPKTNDPPEIRETTLMEKIKKICVNQTAENLDGEGNSEVNQQINDAIAVPSTSQGTLALETLLMRVERARGPSRQLRSFDLCLNELVVGPRVPINESILKHWNNAAVLTSDLARVANTILAAPSTQVSVERLFSSLKFILNPLRSNLSQHLLRDIMLIRQNKDLIE